MLFCTASGGERIGPKPKLTRFFGLPRIIHRIEPMKSLPQLGERYDLVDGGTVVLCFNLNPKTGAFYSPRVATLLDRPPGFEPARTA
jgi:hypothetical protein